MPLDNKYHCLPRVLATHSAAFLKRFGGVHFTNFFITAFGTRRNPTENFPLRHRGKLWYHNLFYGGVKKKAFMLNLKTIYLYLNVLVIRIFWLNGTVQGLSLLEWET